MKIQRDFSDLDLFKSRRGYLSADTHRYKLRGQLFDSYLQTRDEKQKIIDKCFKTDVDTKFYELNMRTVQDAKSQNINILLLLNEYQR